MEKTLNQPTVNWFMLVFRSSQAKLVLAAWPTSGSLKLGKTSLNQLTDQSDHAGRTI